MLAKELGIKIPRVHQIGVAADKKVREAIDWEPIITPRFPPTWSLIEEWCDERPKKQPPRVEVRFCWADAKRGRRIYKRTLVEEASVIEWEGASDYNVNRVRAAIEAGTNSDEIGKSLGIPTTICEDPSYNPALHLASLAAMRLAAARQDEQQAARVQAFKESKRAEMLERCARYKEQRVTLTTKGYEKIRELEQHREAEDAAASPKGSHHAPAARKSSAA